MMDINKFTPQKTGQLQALSGIPSVSHFFLPDNLPPRFEMTPSLWPLLVEARAAIASLDGIGKHLPNPLLLLTPLQRREAQLSSQLEGTITNPRQQLLFELDLYQADQAGDDTSALKEVANYRQALNYHRQVANTLPLSLRLIRELHRILMEGVRGGDNNPGQFRRVQVQIGRPARYVPPPPNLLMPLLDNLEKYIHQNTGYDPLIDAFIVHYQFEAIHPFQDGNGRVGRLLLAMMIAEGCQLSHSWLYMSAFFDHYKDAYLNKLFQVSATGDWEGWLRFCLEGAIFQAKDTQKRSERLLHLIRHYKEALTSMRASSRLLGIVDDLFISPVIQIPKIAKKYDVSYPTAKTDVERLVGLNILSELPNQHPKTFYSDEIFGLIYNDTFITEDSV